MRARVCALFSSTSSGTLEQATKPRVIRAIAHILRNVTDRLRNNDNSKEVPAPGPWMTLIHSIHPTRLMRPWVYAHSSSGTLCQQASITVSVIWGHLE